MDARMLPFCLNILGVEPPGAQGDTPQKNRSGILPANPDTQPRNIVINRVLAEPIDFAGLLGDGLATSGKTHGVEKIAF